MRTTLNINDDLMSELMELSGINNKTKLIEMALSDLIRKLKRGRIKSACGKIDLKVDIIELRKRELDE